MREGAVKDLKVIIKGDVQGSVEAIVSELAKIQHPEVRVNVIHQGVGGITENDIMLAAASGGMVVGFNVRPNAETRSVAEREGVAIRTYDVIYKLTEEIEQALVGMLAPVSHEETIGEAEVRALFRVSRLGTIAGCMVTSGVIRRSGGTTLPQRPREPTGKRDEAHESERPCDSLCAEAQVWLDQRRVECQREQ